METVGNVIIGLGALFIFFGLFGIFRFKNFYSRILVAAKIDTVGMLTVIAGVAVKQGVGVFTLKLLLLAVLVIIINPLTAHITARCAHISGYKSDGNAEKQTDTED